MAVRMPSAVGASASRQARARTGTEDEARRRWRAEYIVLRTRAVLHGRGALSAEDGLRLGALEEELCLDDLLQYRDQVTLPPAAHTPPPPPLALAFVLPRILTRTLTGATPAFLAP